MNQALSQSHTLRRIASTIAAIALASAIAVAIGWAVDPDQFFKSYLFSFVFWLGVPAGALVFKMVHNLTGGDWGRGIRLPLEAAVASFPVMLILFLPLVFGLDHLYVWAKAGFHAEPWTMTDKAAYLDVGTFLVRAAIYFGIWIATVLLLRRGAMPRGISAAGICLYFLTASFAAVDWVMSLDPSWTSSIYGLIFIASQCLSGLAFVVMIVGVLPNTAGGALEKDKTKRDLGSLLTMAVLLWAYLHFSQLIIVWQGDTTAEIPWYLDRTRGAWRLISWFLMIFHFAVPFFFLLMRRIKQDPGKLAFLCGALIAVHLIDVYWFVVPSFREPSWSLHWLDIAAPLAIGSVWLAIFFYMMASSTTMSQEVGGKA